MSSTGLRKTGVTLINLLFPGSGHLFLGVWKKGFCLLLIAAGIFLTLFFSDILVLKAVALSIYLVTAGLTTWEIRLMMEGRLKSALDRSRLYITLMLLFNGFTAIPLLWNSSAYSRSAKVAWTVAVPVLAGVFFSLLAIYGSDMEAFLESLAG